MNEIEEKLWDYIDGLCTADEQKAISLLIEHDEAYRLKYRELLQLNAEFSAMELDEPSMAFTYNVMETIRTQNANEPLKASIDKRIIGGIGAFFVFTIVLLLGIVLKDMNWSTGSSAGVKMASQIKIPAITSYLSGNVIKGFVFFEIVMALFLLDTYLRKRLSAKQQQ
jgi:hypothetical protein